MNHVRKFSYLTPIRIHKIRTFDFLTKVVRISRFLILVLDDERVTLMIVSIQCFYFTNICTENVLR